MRVHKRSFLTLVSLSMNLSSLIQKESLSGRGMAKPLVNLMMAMEWS